jgi:hypothetical protein
VLDLYQADTARQLAGKVGIERDVEADDSRRAASAGTIRRVPLVTLSPQSVRTDRLVLFSPGSGETGTSGPPISWTWRSTR